MSNVPWNTLIFYAITIKRFNWLHKSAELIDFNLFLPQVSDVNMEYILLLMFALLGESVALNEPSLLLLWRSFYRKCLVSFFLHGQLDMTSIGEPRITPTSTKILTCLRPHRAQKNWYFPLNFCLQFFYVSVELNTVLGTLTTPSFSPHSAAHISFQVFKAKKLTQTIICFHDARL